MRTPPKILINRAKAILLVQWEEPQQEDQRVHTVHMEGIRPPQQLRLGVTVEAMVEPLVVDMVEGMVEDIVQGTNFRMKDY
jgi:hypothetical protein